MNHENISYNFCFGIFINVNAQLTLDDFATGTLNTTYFTGADTDLFQSGRNIEGKNRLLKLHIGNKEDDQNVQLAVKNKKLIGSFGYNTNGVLKVIYGRDAGGKKPLDLDLSKYENLIIEFDGKSSKSSVHVTLFTKTHRAFWRSNIKERHGTYTLKIPMVEFEKVSEDFTVKDVDQITFQFNSGSVVGNNFAINKIWFN